MNLVNLLFFLEDKEIESDAPLRRVTPFNPQIKREKNSFFICKNGISEKVYPREFKEIKDIENGISTIDFCSKPFLKVLLEENALISSEITYTAKIGRKKGYILELFVKLEGKLEELYNKELEAKAERFFE